MREMPGQALLVVCNFTDRPVKFNTELSGAKGRLLLANYDDTTKEPPEQIDLRPYEGALWLIEA